MNHNDVSYHIKYPVNLLSFPYLWRIVLQPDITNKSAPAHAIYMKHYLRWFICANSFFITYQILDKEYCRFIITVRVWDANT